MRVRCVVVLSIYYHLHTNLMPHYIKGTSTTGTQRWLWRKGGCVIVQYKYDFFFFCKHRKKQDWLRLKLGIYLNVYLNNCEVLLNISFLFPFNQELLSPSWCRSSCLLLTPWRAAGTPSQSFWTWRSVQDLRTGAAHHILREKQGVGKRRILNELHEWQHLTVFPSPAIWTHWKDQGHNPEKDSRTQLTSNWWNSHMGKWRTWCMPVHTVGCFAWKRLFALCLVCLYA